MSKANGYPDVFLRSRALSVYVHRIRIVAEASYEEPTLELYCHDGAGPSAFPVSKARELAAALLEMADLAEARKAAAE